MLKLPGPHAGLSIGLFGGSFNPAHDGHLHVAETAMRRLHLDWVWWIVARGNPLKQDHGAYSARLSSASAMVSRQPRMRVTDIERQGGWTYSVDTIEALQARAPDARFVWVMGADSLESFHQWKAWQRIAARVPIVIVARPGALRAVSRAPFVNRFVAARVPSERAIALPFSEAPAWTYLTAPLNTASSTALRTK